MLTTLGKWVVGIGIAVLVIGAGGWIAWRLTVAREADRRISRATEARVIGEAGHPVADQVSQVDLEVRARALEIQNLGLLRSLEQARRDLRSARVVRVDRESTGAVPVTGTIVPKSGTGCVLTEGDQVDLRVAAVDLETPAGNRVVSGEISAWRLEPLERIATGPFRVDLGATSVSIPPRLPGWGAGPRVSWSGGQVRAGLQVSPPPWQVFGHGLELHAGLGVGETLSIDASAAIIVRW